MKITRNEQFNSYEIEFDGKPSEEIRTLLKANGYRWHGVRKIWYGYKDISDKLNGEPITTEKTEEPQYNIDKNLIKEYAELYGRGNKSDAEYMEKSTAAVIRLNDGLLVAIEKPRIQKHFCFNRDYNGLYDEESERRADEMAEYARTQESYFLEKNLCPVLKDYKRFATEEITAEDVNRSYSWQRAKYKSPAVHKKHYLGHDERMAYINFYDDPEKICGGEDKKPEDARWLEPNEIEEIKKAYRQVITDFKKRLQTYLKKYGLSKLKVWTYYSD